MKIELNFCQKTKEIINHFSHKKAREDFSVFCELICKELFLNINTKEKWLKVLLKEVNKITNKDINFILNAPPRLGKTLFMSILYPCWLIGNNPFLKILILSASEQMRADTDIRIKLVLKSEIYKKIFNEVKFSTMGAEIKQTDKTGNITLLSSGTNLTGAGFNVVIGDDFFNPTQLTTQYHITRQIFLENALGRKEHKPKTKFIILEQTLSLNDTTHILKEKWKKEEYKQIIFPYQFTEQAIGLFENKFDDIEFELNEFLSDRFNEKTKDLIIRERGNETFLTQYQQIPTDAKDVVIKKEWFRYYENYNSIDFSKLYFTCDTALKNEQQHDYSVYSFWGISNNNLYLIDMLRSKYLIHEATTAAANFWYKWQEGINEKNNNPAFYIEDKGSGTSLIQNLKKFTGVPALPTPVKRNKDKSEMLSSVINHIEVGRVFLPKNNIEITNQLINECIAFRRNMTHKHDDIVDTLVDALLIGISKTNIIDSWVFR
jgi:predicted phage terminase large subunit-like protein